MVCVPTACQASVCQRQSSSSSTGSLVQPAGVSQNSVSICVSIHISQILFGTNINFCEMPTQNQITLPASPVAAQLIGQTQTSNSTAVATTISQQAMLLGNRPVNCNQAQMYLRTQMVDISSSWFKLSF